MNKTVGRYDCSVVELQHGVRFLTTIPDNYNETETNVKTGGNLIRRRTAEGLSENPDNMFQAAEKSGQKPQKIQKNPAYGSCEIWHVFCKIIVLVSIPDERRHTMEFVKMNGAGNDFIIVNNMNGEVAFEKWPEIVKLLCERHMSIGADGFMVVEKPDGDADYKMLFFNSDGSMG